VVVDGGVKVDVDGTVENVVHVFVNVSMFQNVIVNAISV
jgi:hypothetical protein